MNGYKHGWRLEAEAFNRLWLWAGALWECALRAAGAGFPPRVRIIPRANSRRRIKRFVYVGLVYVYGLLGGCLLAQAYSGTTTGAPLSLSLPDADTDDWATQINANFSVINSSYSLLELGNISALSASTVTLASGKVARAGDTMTSSLTATGFQATYGVNAATGVFTTSAAVGTSTLYTTFDVNGNAQFGSTAKSTFSTTGALTMADEANITATGNMTADVVTGNSFVLTGATVTAITGTSKVRLSSNLTFYGSVHASITGLSFALAADSRYYFEADLAHSSTATATGVKFGMTMPASSTFTYTVLQTITATTQSISRVFGSSTAVTGATVGAIDIPEMAHIRGNIQTSAAGTLQLTVASELANGRGMVWLGSGARLYEQ